MGRSKIVAPSPNSRLLVCIPPCSIPSACLITPRCVLHFYCLRDDASRPKRRTMIASGVATLAVAAVGMAAVALYSTSSSSVAMLSKTHTLVSCALTSCTARAVVSRW